MNKRILILLFGVVILAFLFWYSNSLQSEFYLIADFFNTLALQHEFLAVLLFVFSATLGALISPFTNLPLVPFAVAIWGIIPTTVLLLCGWLIGDVIAYFIGRYLGRRVVSYFVAAKKLDEFSSMVKKRTHFLTALTIRIALPAELGYVFGLVKYNFGLYLIITFIAELPFAIISTNASEAVIAGDVQKFFVAVLFLVMVISVAFVKMRAFKKGTI